MFPTNGNIPQPSAFPAVTGNFDPVAPAFRPSTAPVYAPTNPYGNFSNPGWNLGNLFGGGNLAHPRLARIRTANRISIPAHHQEYFSLEPEAHSH